MENIFFDTNKIKRIGRNVIIGKTVRIRYPELVEIGDNVIIDDFTYISTGLKIHDYVHISSGCKIIGGKEAFVEFCSFSTLSPGVVLAAGSDDYISGIATPMIPSEYKGKSIIGKIILKKHCIVGSNTVILPNVILEEGVSIGSLSLVNANLDEWMIYAEIPAKKIRQRDRDVVSKLEDKFLNKVKHA